MEEAGSVLHTTVHFSRSTVDLNWKDGKARAFSSSLPSRPCPHWSSGLRFLWWLTWGKHLTQMAVLPATILVPFRPLGRWAMSWHLKNRGQDGSPWFLTVLLKTFGLE